MKKEIDAYCPVNLGDNIINFIFFYQIKSYIEQNNLQINYYCQEKHHNNLKDFNCSDNIKILPFQEKGFLLWQAKVKTPSTTPYIEDVLCNMFNDFLSENNIPVVVDKFEYQDLDLLTRYDKIDAIYKDLDILIINSSPQSSQFDYDKTEFDNLIIELNKKYKVATSLKVNDEILSLDNFCVKDIAALATHSKKIIAINTGPSIGLYNTDILNNVDSIYILDTAGNVFKTRKVITCRNLSDLSFLLDKNIETIVFNRGYDFNLQYLLWFFILLMFICIVVFGFNPSFRKLKKVFLTAVTKTLK
jgi:hypothetical protein